VSLRTARLLAVTYFLVMLAAVVWPGATAASRVEPRILGLPFSFAWPALWVAGSVAVLAWLDRVEARHRAGGRAGSPSHRGPGEAERPGRTTTRAEGRDRTTPDAKGGGGERPDPAASEADRNGAG
jgi:hypothetical protein